MYLGKIKCTYAEIFAGTEKLVSLQRKDFPEIVVATDQQPEGRVPVLLSGDVIDRFPYLEGAASYEVNASAFAWEEGDINIDGESNKSLLITAGLAVAALAVLLK